MSITVDTRIWVVVKDYPEWMDDIALSMISKGYLLSDDSVSDGFKCVSKSADRSAPRNVIQHIFY